MSLLENILSQKRIEVQQARAAISLDELKKRTADLPHPRPFTNALKGNDISVIAEIKKASPSRGLLSENFDALRLAREFEQGGAAALSVLTDERFFQGQKSYIHQIKSAVSLPVLRKDFIIEEYQVYESLTIGADAVLLIVRALSDELLQDLYECARSLGLDVLVEVHGRGEIERANRLEAELIGINNRDLSTFNVSLERSIELRPLLHRHAIAVSESGIKTNNDVVALRRAKFDALLVGESLITAEDRVQALQQLLKR